MGGGQGWDQEFQHEALGKVALLFGGSSEEQITPAVEITQENEEEAGGDRCDDRTSLPTDDRRPRAPLRRSQLVPG